jgi:formylglycine-generating enzyme
MHRFVSPRSAGLCGLAILAATMIGSAQAGPISIAMVTVGDPGNAADPSTKSIYGAVAYNYQIGTYDVTNAQYVAFLNAKATTVDPYGLWNLNMAFSNSEGAISRSGTGPYNYSVKPGFANKPVVYVSWYDAVRFVNWLTNGQGNGGTESGTYTITNGGNNSGTVAVPDATQRATWAATGAFHWLLPSENEWYKAAYYNGALGTYYTYPFQSSSPTVALAPPGNTNSGNFRMAAFNYDGNMSYLTDVGAYPNSLSPYGSFDMGGDVNQWNESLDGPLRGGGWDAVSTDTAASFRSFTAGANSEFRDSGFRVASVGGVPEPPAIALLVVGMFAITAMGLTRPR